MNCHGSNILSTDEGYLSIPAASIDFTLVLDRGGVLPFSKVFCRFVNPKKLYYE